jgi:hypothetical protein
MSMHSRLEHLEQIARLVAAERHAESAISDHDEAESELADAESRRESTAKELQEAKQHFFLETKLRELAEGQEQWEEEVARVEPIYRAMCASPEWQRLCVIAEDLGRGPLRLKMAAAQRGDEIICLPTYGTNPTEQGWLPGDRMIDWFTEWSVEEPFEIMRLVEAPLDNGTRWTIATVASFADLAPPIPVTPLKQRTMFPYSDRTVGKPETVLPVMARYFVDLVAREELIPFLMEKLASELMRIEAELLDEL